MEPASDDDQNGNEYSELALQWRDTLIDFAPRDPTTPIESTKPTNSRDDACGRCDKSPRYLSIIETLYREKLRDQVIRVNPIRRFKLEQDPIPESDNGLRGTQLEDNNPPPKPYTCDLRCAICYDQFFSATQAVEDNDAFTTMRDLVDSIQSDLGYL